MDIHMEYKHDMNCDQSQQLVLGRPVPPAAQCSTPGFEDNESLQHLASEFIPNVRNCLQKSTK